MSTTVIGGTPHCGGSCGSRRYGGYKRRRVSKYACRKYVKRAFRKKKRYDAKPISNLYRYGATALTLNSAQKHLNKLESAAYKYADRINRAITVSRERGVQRAAPGGGVGSQFSDLTSSIGAKRAYTDLHSLYSSGSSSGDSGAMDNA